MIKKHKTDKLYKISVLTLLVLILASLIAIISMINPINMMYDGDYAIEIGSEDFDNLGINVIGSEVIHYSEDYYTFEEFGRYANQNISNFNDVSEYAIKNNYELSYDDDFLAEFNSEENCTFDPVREKEICLLTNLMVDKTTSTILLSISSMGDSSALMMIESNYPSNSEFNEGTYDENE